MLWISILIKIKHCIFHNFYLFLLYLVVKFVEISTKLEHEKLGVNEYQVLKYIMILLSSDNDFIWIIIIEIYINLFKLLIMIVY